MRLAEVLVQKWFGTQWFVQGQSVDGTLVDIVDGDRDIATQVAPDEAARIIATHNATRSMLIEMLDERIDAVHEEERIDDLIAELTRRAEHESEIAERVARGKV